MHHGCPALVPAELKRELAQSIGIDDLPDIHQVGWVAELQLHKLCWIEHCEEAAVSLCVCRSKDASQQAGCLAEQVLACSLRRMLRPDPPGHLPWLAFPLCVLKHLPWLARLPCSAVLGQLLPVAHRYPHAHRPAHCAARAAGEPGLLSRGIPLHAGSSSGRLLPSCSFVCTSAGHCCRNDLLGCRCWCRLCWLPPLPAADLLTQPPTVSACRPPFCLPSPSATAAGEPHWAD